MAFDWRRFHVLAIELAERDDEAAQRSAISRAYYAAYGVTARYLIERRVLTPGSINHRAVWQAFGDPADRHRSLIRNWGFALKDARELADYRDQPSIDLGKKADESLRLSRRLIETVDRISAEPWP